MIEFIAGFVLAAVLVFWWMARIKKLDEKYWEEKISTAEAKAYKLGELEAWNSANKMIRTL